MVRARYESQTRHYHAVFDVIRHTPKDYSLNVAFTRKDHSSRTLSYNELVPLHGMVEGTVPNGMKSSFPRLCINRSTVQ